METTKEGGTFVHPRDLLHCDNYDVIIDEFWKLIKIEEYNRMIKRGQSAEDARVGSYSYAMGSMCFYLKWFIREYRELEESVKDR